jgi:23S rRNA (adenine2030-N6)-methyltransferase
MKYLHAYHAGNFADVHKHVTLLALLAALKRKDKGFFYLETHAGRGRYELGTEAQGGIQRLDPAKLREPELREYVSKIVSHGKGYPGSPVLAARELRSQDRAVFIEIQPPEARALQQALESAAAVRVETEDGFERLRAHLPPRERRGLTFIDPPYEETRHDFERVTTTLGTALLKFPTGVVAAWYPVKQERDTAAWLADLKRQIAAPLLTSELWLYPRDSRVALNGSGLVIANPPYQLDERMRAWLPELYSHLDAGHAGGTSVELSR